jgi:hypothetical protein
VSARFERPCATWSGPRRARSSRDCAADSRTTKARSPKPFRKGCPWLLDTGSSSRRCSPLVWTRVPQLYPFDESHPRARPPVGRASASRSWSVSLRSSRASAHSSYR